MNIELGTLLLRLQGRVVGYGPWDREVAATPGGQADHEEDPSTWWLKYQPRFFHIYPGCTFGIETRMRYWCSGSYHIGRAVYIAPCLSGRMYPSMLLLLAWEGSHEASPLLESKQKVEIKVSIRLHHVYYLFVRCWQPAYGAARQQCELWPSPVTFLLYGPDLNLIICTGQVSFNEVCGESPVSKSVHVVLSEGSERREWYMMFYFYFLVLFHLVAIQLWFLNSYKQWDSNTKSNCF